jgi:hypothetical protein
MEDEIIKQNIDEVKSEKKIKEPNPVGRPTIMTPDIVNKLEEIFAIGGTDEEACFYADISKQTLYNYQDKNPEFVDRKEALKETPILLARRTIVEALKNPLDARWYLEKKRKKEFGNVVDITSGGEKLGSASPEAVKLAEKYEEELKKLL